MSHIENSQLSRDLFAAKAGFKPVTFGTGDRRLSPLVSQIIILKTTVINTFVLSIDHKQQ